jgi:hypothetical protein
MCQGRGYILRRRPDGSETQEPCLRCDGAQWARKRAYAQFVQFAGRGSNSLAWQPTSWGVGCPRSPSAGGGQ